MYFEKMKDKFNLDVIKFIYLESSLDIEMDFFSIYLGVLHMAQSYYSVCLLIDQDCCNFRTKNFIDKIAHSRQSDRFKVCGTSWHITLA